MENPNFTQIATIKPSCEPKFTLRFNAISEMEFEINEKDVNGDIIPYYDSIVKNKIIHTNEFGDWVIYKTSRNNTGTCEKKTVSCYSYEYTISIKDANIDAGTYKFYSPTPAAETSTPLLNLIMKKLPGWELGFVSSDLYNKYRTFDMPDGSLYAFMTEDMAEAYEVFFVFDYKYEGGDTESYVGGHWRRFINAYTKSDLIDARKTDVILRWNNLLKNVNIEETDDGIVTALSVYGAGDFSIDSINPWGNVIYDFSYYGNGHGKGSTSDPDYCVEIAKLQHFLNISTYATSKTPPLSIPEDGDLTSDTISMLQGWLNSQNNHTNIEITGIIDYETRNAVREAIERGTLNNVYRGILTEGWMTDGLWNKVKSWQDAVERETYSTESWHFPALVKRKREITDVLLKYDVEKSTIQSYLDSAQAIIDARIELIASSTSGVSTTMSDTSAKIIESLKNSWLCNGKFNPNRLFTVGTVGGETKSLFEMMYPIIDKYYSGAYTQFQFLTVLNKQIGQVSDELSMYMFETLKLIINGDYSGYDSSKYSLPITLANPPFSYSNLPCIFPNTVSIDGKAYNVTEWFGVDGDGAEDCSYADACINLYICQVVQNYLTNFLVYGYDILSDEATRLINIQSKKWQIDYDGSSVDGATFHFTEEEQIELDKYVFGSTYTNEYYVVTDQMSYSEQNDLAKELYEQAKNMMMQLSQPTYTFTLESVNFLFSKEYRHYADQLQLGSTVYAEIKEADWVTPILLELSFNYNNPDEFSMTFGNRYRLQTSEYAFADLYDQVTKTSGTISKDFHDLITPSRSGQIDEMQDFINGMLDTSKNKILAGINQSMMIDEHGLVGRKSMSTVSGDCRELLYEDEQVRLINNMLCFTNDGWRTVKTALGKIQLSDGTSTWGVVGESIFGKLIAGGQLAIQNNDKSFLVDGTGVSITNSKFVSYSASSEEDSKVKVSIDPTDSKYVFAVYGRTTTGDKLWGIPKLYADKNGNIVIDSSLTTIAKVGGWSNNANSLDYKGSAFYTRLGSGVSNVTPSSYAFSAGTMSGGKEYPKFTVTYDGKLTATNAVINGEINATKATFKNVTIDGQSTTWNDGTFNNIKCNELAATNGTFTNCSFSGTLVGASGSFTDLTGTGKVELGSRVTIDTAGITLLGATDTVRFFMNPPTASGGAEARWVSKGGYSSLGLYTSTKESKKDISPIGDECSNIIDKLSPVYFRFKDQANDSYRSVGFIAEETDEICKEITSYSDKNIPVGVQYSNITALLTAEVQRLRKRINTLERKLYL